MRPDRDDTHESVSLMGEPRPAPLAERVTLLAACLAGAASLGLLLALDLKLGLVSAVVVSFGVASLILLRRELRTLAEHVAWLRTSGRDAARATVPEPETPAAIAQVTPSPEDGARTDALPLPSDDAARRDTESGSVGLASTLQARVASSEALPLVEIASASSASSVGSDAGGPVAGAGAPTGDDAPSLAQARTTIDGLIAAREWNSAIALARRTLEEHPRSTIAASLESSILAERSSYRASLEKSFLVAANEGRAEDALSILQELDFYLTPAEAEPLREVVRGVISRARDSMGESFKLAVQNRKWQEAVSLGERIMAQFPNTRMAQEVRDVIDALRLRAVH